MAEAFDSLLDALGVGIILTDPTQPDNPIVRCNTGFRKITGYVESEALGRNCRFLQGADTDGAAVEEIRQALREARDCHVVLKNYRKDGAYFWNNLTISPIQDAEGKITHFCAILSDITAFHEGQQRIIQAYEKLKVAYARERHISETLEASELLIADILESITDGFAAVDDQWRFTYLNQQGEALLQRTRQELLGTGFYEAFPQAVDTPFDQQLHQAQAERVSVKFTEYYAPLSVWFEMHAYPMPEGLAIYFRDVTEHQRAEQEKQEMVARQRVFLRDVLASVTEGKLRLCNTPEELPPPLTPVGDPILLSKDVGLGDLRHLAEKAARAAGFSEEQRCDLVLAVGEAAMNAAVHAGTGIGTVSANAAGTVQVRIEDHGTGISVENLPKATLERGFTTAGTMGHGMKMMLELLDRLWLLTGADGTTVVLERDGGAHEEKWR